MSLEISHFDANNFDIYALLFNNNNECFSIVTSGFESYNDISITGFAINLPENTGRLGWYNTTINEFQGFDRGDYYISIYRQIGADPNKSDDKLRASSIFYWNGNTVVDNIDSNQMSEIYAGTAYLSHDMNFMIRFKDKFNFNTNNDNNINYAVYDNGSLTSVTGVMSNIATGLYVGSFNISTGIFNDNHQYTLYVSTNIGNEEQSVLYNFSVEELAIDALAYVEGRVLVGAVSGIISNLSSTSNNHFNGGIIRMKTGNLRGHARIIYSYTGSNKFIRFNNNMISAPASGDYFVIYPIGGELNT